MRELKVASKGALSEFLKAVRELQKAKPPREEAARGKRAIATQVKIAALQGTAWFKNVADICTELVTVELGQQLSLIHI
eukprot:5240819-Prorocentrum_lima.AAC.1